MEFFVPGSDEPAVVTGFGAVYLDIDTDHTAFEYFDIDGNSLGEYAAPVADNEISFLGVVFSEAIVHSVRITYGTDALGPADGGEVDVAVMDNFVYGEPQPVDSSGSRMAATGGGIRSAEGERPWGVASRRRGRGRNRRDCPPSLGTHAQLRLARRDSVRTHSSPGGPSKDR
jgi:hypothetical protein